MSAYIVYFPARRVACRLEQALAGCVHACWQCRCDDDVDIEAIARLHRALSAQTLSRAQARRMLEQVDAATDWLETARQHACIKAAEDGECASEDADYYARRAVDLVGALGLLEQCRERLQQSATGGELLDIDAAWIGLEMAEG